MLISKVTLCAKYNYRYSPSKPVWAVHDLMCHGFDTHNEHDLQHTALYNHMADGIDYFWNFAGELEYRIGLPLS